MKIDFKKQNIKVTATAPGSWHFQVSTASQQQFAIEVSAASTGFWQSEIRDSQQRLLGCTCDRAPENVFAKAIALLQAFLTEPGLTANAVV
ncbi:MULTISPECIES: hypothetical protein [Trichocoleus]|uniref:Uncharacterized protein n=1 Tax=Trichocoleus desertorum GB2-A4 TaxID=2933944 RepID=A0ABV0JCS1_9CYAN|nr:hypothetical protein [Trichocoleus sp. FACHB-46]MBD1864087.1 hypothetical protein [Trichocoleus sp. FACHB-46]